MDGMDKRCLLRTSGLAIGYDGTPLIRDIELSVHRGEILALIGPNGAGKSTLLKTITQQLAPVAGTVLLDEKSLSSFAATEIAQRMSVLLTGHVRTDLLTCLDIVEAGRYPYTGRLGMLTPEDRTFVRDTMDLIGVWELRNRDFMCISDGQRQRVLLARAIAQDPDVVILDEPTSYLDIRYQIELLHILQKLTRERNMAVVMSIHELDLARKIADTVVCVKGEHIARIGTPEDVFTREVIEDLYDLEPGSYDPIFGVMLEHELPSPPKGMRCGFTTGTCAAAATRGAAELLLTGTAWEAVSIETPSGDMATLELEQLECGPTWARCAVRKDAGDDPDVTHGMLVEARVERTHEPGIVIDGGEGIGRVTLPGLDQPVGAAAINSVPRAMIAEQVRFALANASKNKGANSGDSDIDSINDSDTEPNPNSNKREPASGFAITISIPGGSEVAAKTFNPRLGIQGGLSILGTSGIVKPMSEEALQATIRAELSLRRAAGHKHAVVAPGNYGLDFACEKLGIAEQRIVQCSNYIGTTIDMAADLGFSSLFVIGHIGKLAKIAAGNMNTHSRVSDSRREALAAHAACCGASTDIVRAIMESATTDAAIDILDKADMLNEVMAALINAIGENLQNRANGRLDIEAVMFSKTRGFLGSTSGAEKLTAYHKEVCA